MIQYYAEDVHSASNMISLKLKRKRKTITLQSVTILEEQHIVFLFLHMRMEYLDEVKRLLESTEITSSKLYRQYYW